MESEQRYMSRHEGVRDDVLLCTQSTARSVWWTTPGQRDEAGEVQ